LHSFPTRRSSDLTVLDQLDDVRPPHAVAAAEHEDDRAELADPVEHPLRLLGRELVRVAVGNGGRPAVPAREPARLGRLPDDEERRPVEIDAWSTVAVAAAVPVRMGHGFSPALSCCGEDWPGGKRRQSGMRKILCGDLSDTHPLIQDTELTIDHAKRAEEGAIRRPTDPSC